MKRCRALGDAALPRLSGDGRLTSPRGLARDTEALRADLAGERIPGALRWWYTRTCVPSFNNYPFLHRQTAQCRVSMLAGSQAAAHAADLIRWHPVGGESMGFDQGLADERRADPRSASRRRHPRRATSCESAPAWSRRADALLSRTFRAIRPILTARRRGAGYRPPALRALQVTGS